MASLGDSSSSKNGFLLVLIILAIVTVPTFAGVLGTLLLVDGWEATFSYLLQPSIMFQRFWQLVEYAWVYREQLPIDFVTNALAPPIGSVVAMLLITFLARAPLMDFRPFKPQESVHGDAQWATKKQMRDMGIMKKKGFLLGDYKKSYLCTDGFQHILLFAPTGSGKGVGFVIPNLLYWEDSVVCHDIKLENYELTSGYRQNKLENKCYVWNPADPDGLTHCYNPIDWVSTKPGQMVDDVQKIANLILPEQDFWQNEARSMVVGVLLYLLAVPEKVKSFGEIVRTLRSDDVTYNLAVVLDTVGKKLHPVAYMNLAAFLQKADKERSGVISTANSSLELWSNPLIDTATASSDFNVMHMKKQKTTVYCGVTPDNLQRLKPLLQVFYQQSTDFYTRKMPQPDEPYGVLMVMDEFPTLGKMPQFEAGIAYFRGYHVRLFLIVQDTQQLKGIYEESGMNSFLSNSTYRITFAANNVETANLISQLIGNKTVRQESHNAPRFFDMNPASRTRHVSETARALLLPQEVIGLPRDEQIILIESQPPIRCNKIFYYKDPFFTKRLLPQVDVPIQEPYDPNKKHVPKEKTAAATTESKEQDAKNAAAAAGKAPAGKPASAPPAATQKNAPPPPAAKAPSDVKGPPPPPPASKGAASPAAQGKAPPPPPPPAAKAASDAKALPPPPPPSKGAPQPAAQGKAPPPPPPPAAKAASDTKAVPPPPPAKKLDTAATGAENPFEPAIAKPKTEATAPVVSAQEKVPADAPSAAPDAPESSKATSAPAAERPVARRKAPPPPPPLSSGKKPNAAPTAADKPAAPPAKKTATDVSVEPPTPPINPFEPVPAKQPVAAVTVEETKKPVVPPPPEPVKVATVPERKNSYGPAVPAPKKVIKAQENQVEPNVMAAPQETSVTNKDNAPAEIAKVTKPVAIEEKSLPPVQEPPAPVESATVPSKQVPETVQNPAQANPVEAPKSDEPKVRPPRRRAPPPPPPLSGIKPKPAADEAEEDGGN